MKVLLLFFCSGATALVYEVLWSKYLSRLLGSTVQAQTIVLAVFMGGLALGNRIFGQRADLLKRPLTGYGWIEVAIGVYAFFFAYLYSIADKLFIVAGTPIAEQTFLLFLLKAGMSAGLLLFPTILMGGTLPLLARWLQSQTGGDGILSRNSIGIFYAVNSLGAVFGAGMAGFVLVQQLGTVASLQMTAFFNVIVGVVAIAFGKRDEPLPDLPAEKVSEPLPSVPGYPAPSTGPQFKWLTILVACTGAISMGMEVLAARSLALIVGGSLQAFAIVLMSFILGIGLGSLAISSLRWATRSPATLVFYLLMGASLLIGSYVILIQDWVVLYSHARLGLAGNKVGYIEHQALVAVFAMLVLGLPAALMGAVLPLCMRLVSETGSLVANKVGRLLTANTLGAVFGVLITGFILMPLLGLRTALATVTLLIVALAVGTAINQGMVSARNKGIAVGMVLLAGMLLTGHGWMHTLGSGIFRMRGTALTKEMVKTRMGFVDILYYKDGADATVMVEDSGNEGSRQRVLRINGKADASTVGDLATQYLLAHIPMAAKPDAKQVFILGFGSGITAGAITGHPIEQLTLAENCAPVLEAAPLFGLWNRGVLTNAKTKIRNEDARTVLKLSPPKYDIILSEPSNPWVVGIGSVFSKDFYELAKSKLAPGGLMAQWFHVYEMNDEIVFLVLRTFAEVFPHMEIWDTQQGDIILLGSAQAWESNPAVYQKIFDRTQPKADLSTIGVKTPLHLWCRQVASQRTAFAVAGEGPIQTDEFPILEYSAPEAFFIGAQSTRLFTYDERTHQMVLAPEEKFKTLRAMPETAVLEMFSGFPPMNSELEGYLRMRAAKPANSPPGEGGDPMLPSVWRLPETHPLELPAYDQRGPLYGELLRLEAAMYGKPAEWEQTAGRLREKMVQIRNQPELLRGAAFRPSYYCALACKYYAAHGKYQEAISMLQLGLSFDPNDHLLDYLYRLLSSWAPEVLEKSFSTNAPAMMKTLQPSTNLMFNISGATSAVPSGAAIRGETR